MNAWPPLLELTSLGRLAVFVIALLSIVGVSAAIRGWWGTSRRARRLTVFVALAAVGVGAVAGVLVHLSTANDLATLGPAVTPTDTAHAARLFLTPLLAGFVSLLLVLGVAGLGWVMRRENADATHPPPRRPAR